MKTTITNIKNEQRGLKSLLLIFAFVALGLKGNAQCNADFTYSASPANDGIVSFTNTSTTGSSTLYYWDFSDGGYSNAPSPTYTFAVTGTYTVCMFLYDTLSTCTDSICYTISVTNNSAGGCSAMFTPYDSAGYGYFWNQSTGSGITGTWSFGDGTSGTSTGDITHLYSSPGTYYVCLTVSNFLGCSDSYCDSIRIGGPSSGMCNGSVTATYTATDSAGYGVFTNTVTGTGPVYFWDFGDGTSSSVAGSTAHLYGSPGTYMVCLTVYETGGTYDSCQYCSWVTINAPVLPCDASFVIMQDSTNSFNYFVYNNSTSTSGSATYFWNFGDGTSSTLQYPTHTYASSGPYYLCLTITEPSPALNCSATYCDSIAAGHASVPVTLTVVSPLATGIVESASVASLENYPNPFSGTTTINYSLTADETIELYVTDLLGNKVTSLDTGRRSAGNYTATWNAEDLAAGMYLLQLKTDKKISTRKIVLNK